MAVTALPVQTTAEFFEGIYQDAHGDASQLPWCADRPHPALVTWLNAVAPSLIRCGSRVLVIGCGLGEDTRQLIHRGYEVTAFDCSKRAIDWAQQLDRPNASMYIHADLFKPPLRWKRRFDLVVEVNNLAWMSPELHEDAIKSMAGVMSSHGHLLVIGQAADHPFGSSDGPPWPLMEDQLEQAAALAGMHPIDPPSVFTDDDDPSITWMRGVFARS